MAAYANHAYYTDTYLGNKLTVADFPRLALRASEQIDSMTYGRAKTFVDTDDILKKLCCVLAELIFTDENGGGVSSESNDGYSVSYIKGISNTKTFEQLKNEATVQYLGSTGLLFRGV